MDDSVADSFSYCQRLAQRTGRNFYFSFLTLPRPLFRDMCALYAFMRVTDDLGDDASRSVPQRKAALRSWRNGLIAVMKGEPTSHPVLQAIADVQRRHGLPTEYLNAVVSGVERDLDEQTFETFEELSEYCYLVAGAVGRCCVHLWGYTDEAALDRAVDCGLAFQLTNILRDLKEDSEQGRVYLPAEDLKQFDYTIEDLRARTNDDRFRSLMQFEVDRARQHYHRGAELQPLLEPVGRPILSAMIGIYGRILRKIERRNYDVFTERIRLHRVTKLKVTATSLLLPGRMPSVP